MSQRGGGRPHFRTRERTRSPDCDDPRCLNHTARWEGRKLAQVSPLIMLASLLPWAAVAGAVAPACRACRYAMTRATEAIRAVLLQVWGSPHGRPTASHDGRHGAHAHADELGRARRTATTMRSRPARPHLEGLRHRAEGLLTRERGRRSEPRALTRPGHYGPASPPPSDDVSL